MTIAMSKAMQLVYKRGHLTALHQGGRVECARCGRSGAVDDSGKRCGDIFTRDCGTPTGVSAC